ncbi:hypothetical protein [Phytohabitans houttuyneae]|uniref:Flavin reductase n=1 Tax=Phytohabitans houttuyneae TaxID=1076126 RepID=A0A6V8KFE6_9ACTN|nr:hypothetical protein [Phytohabitans houttuyneae]GFJ79455.1 hypothetical protein Phou_036350 [Phytohabitans houttuyneae]
MTVVVLGDHLPHPPDWVCTGCSKDWPCDPAREALATEFGAGAGVVTLGALMSMHLANATVDLTSVPPAELYERFIAWTRPVPLDAPSPVEVP